METLSRFYRIFFSTNLTCLRTTGSNPLQSSLYVARTLRFLTLKYPVSAVLTSLTSTKFFFAIFILTKLYQLHGIGAIFNEILSGTTYFVI